MLCVNNSLSGRVAALLLGLARIVSLDNTKYNTVIMNAIINQGTLTLTTAGG